MPSLRIPSILQACPESRHININICPIFDEERDRVIVMDKDLDGCSAHYKPPGDLIISKHALKHLKHIAGFQSLLATG
jgi:hypothetical protein